jgi:hypothetical protein
MGPDKEILIDQLLDAALKEYAAAEPRPGLEGRILANLRTERDHTPTQVWRWSMLLAVSTILLIGTAVFFKKHHSNAPVATGNHGTAPTAKKEPTAPKNEPRAFSASRTRRRGKSLWSSVPRLEQFTSPRPLSKQEELLVRYIEQFPREAVLMARAQTELLQQEMIERDAPPEKVVTQDSQEQNP